MHVTGTILVKKDFTSLPETARISAKKTIADARRQRGRVTIGATSVQLHPFFVATINTIALMMLKFGTLKPSIVLWIEDSVAIASAIGKTMHKRNVGMIGTIAFT